jgi:hypothetical protein
MFIIHRNTILQEGEKNKATNQDKPRGRTEKQGEKEKDEKIK